MAENEDIDFKLGSLTISAQSSPLRRSARIPEPNRQLSDFVWPTLAPVSPQGEELNRSRSSSRSSSSRGLSDVDKIFLRHPSSGKTTAKSFGSALPSTLPETVDARSLPAEDFAESVSSTTEGDLPSSRRQLDDVSDPTSHDPTSCRPQSRDADKVTSSRPQSHDVSKFSSNELKSLRPHSRDAVEPASSRPNSHDV